LEKPLVLRRKRYLKNIVDGIEVYAPDKESLTIILDALLILRKSPRDYTNVRSAGFVIFVTRIISRDWNLLKQRNSVRPIWFLDKGMLELNHGYYLASLFVHEARHVYQNVHQTVTSRTAREKDACAEQMRFLSRFRKTTLIKLVQDRLAGEYWIDADKKKRKSYDYFYMLRTKLISCDIL